MPGSRAERATSPTSRTSRTIDDEHAQPDPIGGSRPSGHVRRLPAQRQAEPPAPTDEAGLENLLPVGDGLWSGSAPEGDPGFASLQALGVRTIISVDGAPPDVERAHRFGIRYVHIPFNYGGVTREQALRVIRAASGLPGSIYIHCHHGKHRGPTAAAIVRRCRDDTWTADDAVEFLHRAGTDQRYEGRYGAVREFRLPSADELRTVSGDFPESVPPAGLAAAMVDFDETWTKLERSRTKGWVDARALAVELVEHYREIKRLPDVASRRDAFRGLLAEAVSASEELETAIRADDADRREFAFQRSRSTCTSCHRDHRDRDAK